MQFIYRIQFFLGSVDQKIWEPRARRRILSLISCSQKGSELFAGLLLIQLIPPHTYLTAEKHCFRFSVWCLQTLYSAKAKKWENDKSVTMQVVHHFFMASLSCIYMFFFRLSFSNCDFKNYFDQEKHQE